MAHTMPGNPYEKDANDVRFDPQVRTADALLALAYEQHTANLIALEVLEQQQHVGARMSISPYQAIIRQRMDIRSYNGGRREDDI